MFDDESVYIGSKTMIYRAWWRERQVREERSKEARTESKGNK